jgi:hypothetical protein
LALSTAATLISRLDFTLSTSFSNRSSMLIKPLPARSNPIPVIYKLVDEEDYFDQGTNTWDLTRPMESPLEDEFVAFDNRYQKT